jgi:outer membrane protein assembly factor BamB
MSSAATAAPLDRGGVVTVVPGSGEATVTQYAAADDPTWQLTLHSVALLATSTIPVAATNGGVVVGLPASAAVEVPGFDPTEPTEGTLLVELGPEGQVLRFDEDEATDLQLLVASGDVLYLGTWTEVRALREGQLLWSAPLGPQAMAVAPGGDVIVASVDAIVRLDAATGAPVWQRRVLEATLPTSLGVRADGGVLVGSVVGEVAHLDPDGAVRFQGAVLCQGTVAFGSASGRTVYASHAFGREGWGDLPDRDVPQLTLSFGEVLP